MSGLTPLLPFCGTFNLNNVAELAIWRTRKSFRGRGSALESAGAVYSAPTPHSWWGGTICPLLKLPTSTIAHSGFRQQISLELLALFQQLAH